MKSHKINNLKMRPVVL